MHKRKPIIGKDEASGLFLNEEELTFPKEIAAAPSDHETLK